MASNKYRNVARAKAIEKSNRERLQKINPMLNDRSGIYILTRTDEDGIHYFYCGQAKNLMQRMCGHMVGYSHIDLSLKKRGLHNEKNPYGWKIGVMYYPISELDHWEKHWILEYTKRGYQCRYNKTAGGQGKGKEKINEYRPAKGYRDGLAQGRKNLARELLSIIEKHLIVRVREDKSNNKISQNALDKFNTLLREGAGNNDAD